MNVNDNPTPLSQLLPEQASAIQSAILNANTALDRIYNSNLAAMIDKAIAETPTDPMDGMDAIARATFYLNNLNTGIRGLNGLTPLDQIKAVPPLKPFIIHGKGNVYTFSEYKIADMSNYTDSQIEQMQTYGRDPEPLKPYIILINARASNGHVLGNSSRTPARMKVTMNLENLVIFDHQTNKFARPTYPGSYKHVVMYKTQSGEIALLD
jgi:hypothetical protein